MLNVFACADSHEKWAFLKKDATSSYAYAYAYPCAYVQIRVSPPKWTSSLSCQTNSQKRNAHLPCCSALQKMKRLFKDNQI
ncbi:hypothetical protein POVWA2_027810 [Plasmodium ovale wallikeri]|uniref:Uncharacterized protein n=1 Tax=Plasmodium ovale wallikeri TaxID=864142 RepID=A0A1A8YWT8_PLAOA|nr:hypothetical protein POVWA2_027810 [Plasmodium ovale wallikeri]SBT53993.1 hypothetical protein POVWA1_065340 [Plasmodium ovale wallikeri]